MVAYHTCAGLALATFIGFASAGPLAVKRQGAGSSALPYSIPNSQTAAARAAAIAIKRASFQYGPDPNGPQGPFFPNGTLGQTYVNNALALYLPEAGAEAAVANADQAKAIADAAKYNNLATLQDYPKLYQGEWLASSAPTGIAPGLLGNYTQDLLFSMSRLAWSPFFLRRLQPDTDSLAFSVGDATAKTVTGGDTVSVLFKAGRLFYVDFRNQANLPRSPDKYAAAVDAYFYIAKNGTFLPLAIRTNIGANLVYTPADSFNDWFLAKVMFEVNDNFASNNNHISRTHWVVDQVFQSAVRTLSDEHPILAFLTRVMYNEFAVRATSYNTLYAKGAVYDQVLPFSGSSAIPYQANDYQNGAGQYQCNYLEANLIRRGLLYPRIGPALKYFPYYQDAKAIRDSAAAFVLQFIGSYYASDSTVAGDVEVQNWVTESNGPAKILDFPSAIKDRVTLIGVLTHFVYLSTAAHSSVNLNQLLATEGVYPLHSNALFQPPPTKKGVPSVVPYLPNVTQAITFLTVAAEVARPLFANSNRTLTNLFNDATFLTLTNSQTRTANQGFIASLQKQSQAIRARTFDARGLSQGIPAIWQGLDPNTIPFNTGD